MGIKERKLRDYERRGRLILDTAKDLFAQKGFNGVTLDGIAKGIEFSKGTIYSHFSSKEEIYAHILLERLNRLLDLLKEAARNCENAVDGIRQCLDAYMTFYRKNEDYFQLLFFVDIVSTRYRIPDELLKQIQHQKIACNRVLQTVLRRGREDQEFIDLPNKDVAMVLWGMLNGILQLAESKQIEPDELDPLLEVGFKIVINGLSEKRKSLSENEPKEVS